MKIWSLKLFPLEIVVGFFFFPSVPTLKEENFKYAFEEWLAHFTTQEKTRPK